MTVPGETVAVKRTDSTRTARELAGVEVAVPGEIVAVEQSDGAWTAHELVEGT